KRTNRLGKAGCLGTTNVHLRCGPIVTGCGPSRVCSSRIVPCQIRTTRRCFGVCKAPPIVSDQKILEQEPFPGPEARKPLGFGHLAALPAGVPEYRGGMWPQLGRKDYRLGSSALRSSSFMKERLSSVEVSNSALMRFKKYRSWGVLSLPSTSSPLNE